MKLLKYFENFIYEKRGITLIIVVLLEIGFLYFFKNYFQSAGEILFKSYYGDKWFSNTIPLLIAAPPAFFLWLWRNHDKKLELQVSIENKDLSDFHKALEWTTKTETESQQIAAIYLLQDYIKKGRNLPKPFCTFVPLADQRVSKNRK